MAEEVLLHQPTKKQKKSDLAAAISATILRSSSSDSWSLRRQTDFCIRLYFFLFLLFSARVPYILLLFLLCGLPVFFWVFEGKGVMGFLGVCNPILKRVKSVCRAEQSVQKIKRQNTKKNTNTRRYGDMGIWETEYENYSKKTFSFERLREKIESSSNNMCQKGMSTKNTSEPNEMNACHMVLLLHSVLVCVCVGQIGVYLKPAEMTGCAAKAN